MPQISGLKPLRIGDCRFDPRSHELWRDGECTRLPRRLSQLLLRLAQTAPEVVTRQNLIDDVWQRRMVEDDVLSRAVAELRKALGDDTRTPRYIETIPKAGYRLCATVAEENNETDSGVQTSDSASSATAAALPASATQRRSSWIAAAVVVVVAVSAAVMFLANRSGTDRLTAADTARIRPLTSAPGWESRPDISPDGKWVVYSESEPGGDSSRIVLLGVDGLHREVLEAESSLNVRPVFSPDGKRLAFLHFSDDRCELRLRSIPGGAGRRIADCSTAVGSTPAWSEDQTRIVFTAPVPAGQMNGLSVVMIDSGEVRALTLPEMTEGPDLDPRFVPGRDAITFARGFDGEQKLLYLDVRGDGAKPVMWFDGGRLQGHAWSANAEQLLVATDQPGYRTLVLFDGQGKQTDTLNARGARYPAWSRHGDVVFELAQFDANIWRLALDQPQAEPIAVVASTRYDSSPVLSADGRRLAFVSTRNDFEQIFVSHIDGSDQQKLPMPDGQRWSRPSFSPDGRFVLVTGYDEHNRHGIYRHELATGRNEPLRHLGDDASAAVYADDGRSLFFLRRNRNEVRDLWRAGVAPESTPAAVVGGEGADQFALDGDTLLMSRVNQPGFRVLSVSGALRPRDALVDVQPITRFAWTLRGRNLYAAVREGETNVLKRWDIDTESAQILATGVTPDAVGAAMQVSADERTLWFARTDSLSIDLMHLPPDKRP
jgi:DNA-binding winged helix-turn-helix (wHTH) protein/Tol biopolymer transport system component